jgi:gliding motility-associated-like protein
MMRNVLSFLILVLSFQYATATHLVGGDFSYECLGEVSPGVMRFRFVLVLFRDCENGQAQLENNARIGIHRGTLASSILVKPRNVQGASLELVPIDTPACVNTFPAVCTQSRSYTFEEDLPIINESYFVTYQRCCRNHGIRNLINPQDLGVTIYAEVTPLAQLNCNSSPVFNKLPRTVICNQIALSEDQSATDKDGDLLVYSFCSSLAGGANPGGGGGGDPCLTVQPDPSCGPPFLNAPMVLPNFSPTAPMGGSPLISINSSTGIISGTPNQLGQFVVAICVQEFRNGQPIGSTRREFQFNLADCGANVIAAIQADTLLGPQSYEITSCGEKEIFIQNQSMLGNPPADIEWRFTLGGQPFVTTTPSPTISFPDFGRYRGVLYLNPTDICNDSAEVFINILPGVKAAFATSYDTCVAGPVSFADNSMSEASILAYRWSFENGAATSTDDNPQYQFVTPGLQNVSYYVEDINGCKDQIDSSFWWRPAPPYLIVQPNRFIECAPGLIEFTNLSYPIDSTYTVVWDYGDGQRDSGIISPDHVYQNEGKYDVSLYIQSPIGCEVADTFIQLILMVEPPIAAFEYDTTLALNQFQRTIQFFNKSIREQYQGWIFEPGMTSIQENPLHTFTDTGLVQVTLVATHEQGCKDSISQWLDIVPEVSFTMPNAFTPNGDSENDDFKGNGWSEFMRLFHMQIWNRWGELVFETTKPTEGWNGTLKNNGQLCADGVYLYTVNYTDTRGNTQQLKGSLQLMR